MAASNKHSRPDNFTTLWRGVIRKFESKLRHTFERRFTGLFCVTRRNRRFDHFKVALHFFPGLESREDTVRIIRQYPDIHALILRQANQIIEHRFNLLGSGEVDLGPVIDWHADFKSGYRWPLIYYHLIEMGITKGEYLHDKIDVKVPWELSRLQHLVLLGQAYWVSGNERYTTEFVEQITHWTAANPPEMGVNWVCSMEVSLRVVSMIYAYFLFKSSPLISKPFWDSYFTLLYYSGVHIEQNQEVRANGHGNNHYLTNCAAMLWLGLFFRGYNSRATRWLMLGQEKLCNEMHYQVNPDGGSYEGSIAYHRLVLELFLTTTILAECNGIVFPPDYTSRLEKMCEFSQDLTKPNGLSPQFGDADDGRFCILSGYGTDNMLDHRAVLGTAGIYFKRNDFSETAGSKCWDGFWLFGTIQKAHHRKEHCPVLKSYPYTGYYRIKTDKAYLIVKCGQIGQKGVGGHDHNDQLSFELNIDGVDIVIDPGSYCHSMDKEMRHLFRSTCSHNVSQSGNLEQNIIKNDGKHDMFCMYSHNIGECTSFAILEDSRVRFGGQISIADTQMQYSRGIEVNSAANKITVMDCFAPGSEHIYTARLHLAREVNVTRVSDNQVHIQAGHVGAKLSISEQINIEQGLISPSYGIIQEAWVIAWNFNTKTQFEIQYEV